MINNHEVLGIILARGGSKRLPRKNVKPLAGKPLIAYTIEAARASKYIDRLILSTDDPEATEIAKGLGVEVPFVRPAELAADAITDFPVFEHALTWLKEQEGYIPSLVVQLRPTSPLRTAEHIDRAVALLAAHPAADSVRTVTEPEQSPYKMYKIAETGFLEPLLCLPGVPESFNLPQQKLPKAYKHVGYVDAMWYRTIMEKKQMTGEFVLPCILEDAESGINNQADWDYYEFLMRKST
jgi:N-acylneuraminate cytidylyltransferase